jgi:hypothetical protein
MKLNLSLNGVLIASTPLDPSRCKDEFYLSAMRRLLSSRNEEALALIPSRPVYYIEIAAEVASLRFKTN